MLSLTPSPSRNETGSGLFVILFAIALLAALTYAISQQSSGTMGLSEEKVRLLASDVIDMGNGLSETTARLRLHKVSDTELSFENSIVAGYTNTNCTDETCKIFSYDGGGKDWETPVPEISEGKNWGFTGSLAIKNIGTDAADLVAILPGLSQTLCARINVSLGVHDANTAVPSVAAMPASKFTGTYLGPPLGMPTMITSALTDGQKSACLKVTSATGSAVSGTPLNDKYIYYQVLSER